MKRVIIVFALLLISGVAWGQIEVGKWYLPPYPDWVQDTINYYENNGKRLSSTTVWGINAPNTSTNYEVVWRYINNNTVEVYLYTGYRKVRPGSISNERSLEGGGKSGRGTDFGYEHTWEKFVFTR